MNSRIGTALFACGLALTGCATNGTDKDGISVALHKGWTVFEPGDDFSGIAAACPQRLGNVKLYIEITPCPTIMGIAKTLDRNFISSVLEKQYHTLAGMSGKGVHKEGKIKGQRIAYTLFYPDDTRIGILVTVSDSYDLIVFEELDGTLATMHLSPPARKTTNIEGNEGLKNGRLAEPEDRRTAETR